MYQKLIHKLWVVKHDKVFDTPLRLRKSITIHLQYTVHRKENL